MISYDIYLFHYYSFLGLLNKLDDLHVGVKKYYVYNQKDMYLKISRKYRKIIRENFNDYVIVDRLGFVNKMENLIRKPITLISLLIAISMFFNLANRIYLIDISGDYPAIEEQLLLYLKDKGISKFSYNISDKKLKEIELGLKENFNDSLEFIEITKTGGVISLNYKKRRKELVIEDKKGSLYASKDGVIRGFSLSSGVKKVKIYDFVKKGDLLVSDIIITSDNESIVVGVNGKVFASTFYYIEVSCTLSLDIASKQAYLLDKARNEVSKNLNSEDEYIESENVLVNDLDKGYMKIYYVLYEDITI
jgi:hypothetical protein